MPDKEPPPAVPTIEAYAELTAALASGAELEATLAKYDLTEEGWERVEAYWQEALANAMEEDIDGVPPMIERFAQTLSAARLRQAHVGVVEALSLERFAEATRAIQRSRNPNDGLRDLGLDFGEYLRASTHWTQRLAVDKELAQRFVALTSASGRRAAEKKDDES